LFNSTYFTFLTGTAEEEETDFYGGLLDDGENPSDSEKEEEEQEDDAEGINELHQVIFSFTYKLTYSRR
jgi:hypothetical protein